MPAQERTGREPRSRLDRPCDVCRRHKHLCHIPVHGEPCVSCRARKKECTFDAPPTARKRKPREQPNEPPAPEPPRSNAAAGPSMMSFSLPNFASRPLDSPIPDSSMRSEPQRPQPHPLAAVVTRSLLPSSDENASPLDISDGEDEESHFVGNGAFISLALKKSVMSKPSFERVATLAFRQVSSEPRLPVYFIKHQSLQYGRGPETASTALSSIAQRCAKLGDRLPQIALESFMAFTVPAVPFVNAKRLAQSCEGGDGPSFPHALVTGIIAHGTPYMPILRPIRRDLWRDTLLALEDEYRQPRLRTIQLELLVRTSRPSDNTGQTEIGLARAVGAAQLLGLHMDPTHWNLPLWERRTRKRIWWMLLIHDKWRALLHGRPTNIHTLNYNVSVPDLGDSDSGHDISGPEKVSFESFIATCRLTVEIIEKIQANFCTVKAFTDPPTQITRLGILEEIRTQLESFEHSLPASLQIHTPGSPDTPTQRPTGVASFQLSLVGVGVVTHRLILDALSDQLHTAPGMLAVANTLRACERVMLFVLNLTHTDCDLFWMPYSTGHISNTVSLLLRVALIAERGSAIHDAAMEYTVQLVNWLVAMTTSWDVALAALQRTATPLLVASREIEGLLPSYHAIAKVLGLPADEGLNTAADHLLETLGIDLSGADWLDSDFSWLHSSGADGEGLGVGYDDGLPAWGEAAF